MNWPRWPARPDHQGVAAEVSDYQYADPKALLRPDDALVLVLDEIQDPHNLGALARVAESAGATGMVIADRRSAEVTPTVCKSSAGAVEHLKIARVGNISDYLIAAKEADAWVYGAAADGDMAYDQPDYKGKVVMVVGSEGKGMRPKVAKTCDALVSIPQRGQIESLNVSTATAVLIYAVLQSRDGKTRRQARFWPTSPSGRGSPNPRVPSRAVARRVTNGPESAIFTAIKGPKRTVAIKAQ